jgi:spore coat protein U-like protein
MKIIAPIAAGVLLAMAGSAQAATKTTQFQVSATVAKNCIINAAPLSFVGFDGSVDVTSSSTITVRCTNGTAYDVNLSTGSSNDFQTRRMINGTAYLEYNLYVNGTNTIWGDLSNGTGRPATGTGAGLGTTQTLTVDGRLPVTANNAAADALTFTDVITATIVY